MEGLGAFGQRDALRARGAIGVGRNGVDEDGGVPPFDRLAGLDADLLRREIVALFLLRHEDTLLAVGGRGRSREGEPG